MTTHAMFLPMGVLALITFAVLGQIPLRRFKAAAAGRVKQDDFKFGESAQVPGDVSVVNRNYMNLLELPVLFYIVALMFVVDGREEPVGLGLAWTFVALRAVHSAIHVTYNHVFHRLTAFALSNFVLMALWGWFFVG